MSYSTRALPSHLRHPSASTLQSSTSQSPLLLARVNEKKIELENLRQLRDLSAALANQIQALQEKLATLSDGTEAVAAVLSNWHNVLKAINMASMRIPKPARADGEKADTEVPLPQTLVRIPVDQARLPQVSPTAKDAEG